MIESKPIPPLVLAPAPRGAAADVKAEVARLEAAGIDGVHAGDHLVVGEPAQPAEARRPGEPLALLGAAGMASDRMVLAMMVANPCLTPPLSVARAGAQMAELFGGERVWVGLGAGWSPADYRSTSRSMPRHRERMQLLTESATLLRALFDDGRASLDGEVLRVDDLPLSPLPATPPRLLIGGGSRPVLELAGATADIVDLNSPFQPRLPGGAWAADAARRASTTVDDIARAIAVVAGAARAAGRPRPLFSVTVDLVRIDDRASDGDTPPTSPYLLVGTADDVGAKLRALTDAGVGAIAVATGASELRALIDDRRFT